VTRAYREVVFPTDEGTRQRRDTAGVRNVAKRLRELMDETSVVPEKLAGEVARVLDRLLEVVGDGHEVAA
jgi:phosphoenolpyruvate synthase/pyruvate phosphate dikinase